MKIFLALLLPAIFYLSSCGDLPVSNPCYEDFYIKSSKPISNLELTSASIGCGGITKTLQKMDSTTFRVKVYFFSSNFSCPVVANILYIDSTTENAILDSVLFKQNKCQEFSLFYYSIKGKTYENDTIVFP